MIDTLHSLCAELLKGLESADDDIGLINLRRRLLIARAHETLASLAAARRTPAKEMQIRWLQEIFEETERPDRVLIVLDPRTKSVTVEYEDMDDEWFNELWQAGERP